MIRVRVANMAGSRPHASAAATVDQRDERERTAVDAGLRHARNPRERGGGRAREPERQRRAGGRPRHGEQQHLAHHGRDDLPSRAADRRADRELRRAAVKLHEQESRGVGDRRSRTAARRR